MNNLKVRPVEDDNEVIPSAEAIRLDEGGIDLLVDGETALSASFDGLDPFELAFRVLPEDFELEPTEKCWDPLTEEEYSADLTDDELEMAIWIHLNEYANRKGLKK